MQLTNHPPSNNLTRKFQSAYRACHSIETALLRTDSDIFAASDANHVSILALLNLSAAFDTTDHSILLSRLQQYFCVSGPALSWFRSYLSNSFQFVSASGSNSKLSKLDYGVPQGSVLGPILFVLYTRPLLQILSNHPCACFSYLFSWYFEPSQPHRITLRLKTMCNLSPIYSACKSSYHKLSKNHKICPDTNLHKNHTQTSNTKFSKN